MRYTGLAIAVIGGIVALFILLATGNQAASTTAPQGAGFLGMTVPLVVAFAGVLVGVSMFLFGGRGYIVTRNPAIRN